MTRIRLWERDYQIINNLGIGPMTTSQIGRYYFSSVKKAGERLTLLSRAGYVKRVPNTMLGVRGKPEFVYYLGKNQRNALWLQHGLLVSECRLRFEAWSRAAGYGGRFFAPGGLSCGLIPDAAFTVSKADKTLLYFLEADRGGEPLKSMAAYSLEHKLRCYAEYFDSGAYQEELARVGLFRGFRVAILVVDDSRVAGVARLAGSLGYEFVLCSTLSRLGVVGFGGGGWTAGDGRSYDLLGRSSARGDLVGELVGEVVEDHTPTVAIRSDDETMV